MHTKIRFKVTLVLWATITIIFYITEHMGLGFNNLISYGGLYKIGGVSGEWWRVITYGFLHNNEQHLIGNLIIGVPLTFYLENKTSSTTALIIFMSGVVFGGIAFIVFEHRIRVVTTGASAGVWAIMGAMTVNMILKIRDIHFLEYLIIAGLNISLFYDTVTATNVNAISHYYGYIASFIIMVILVVISREEVFKKYLGLG